MKSPFPSFTSLAPAVPEWVNVAGVPVAGDVAVLPFPGHPDHTAVLVIPPGAPYVVLAIMDPQRVGLGFAHVMVVNRLSPPYAMLSVEASCEDGGQAKHLMDPLSGVAWTAAALLLSYAGVNVGGVAAMLSGNGSNSPMVKVSGSPAPSTLEGKVMSILSTPSPDQKYENELVSKVANDLADVDVTRLTGSSNMDFHGPASVHAATKVAAGGKPPYAVLLFLDAYARKQVRRSRNWVAPTMAPAGLPYCDPKLTTEGPNAKELLAAIPKIVEWGTNSYGLNPFDVHHPDASELHRMYALTEDPFYLLQQQILYFTMRTTVAYWRPAAKQGSTPWAGVARIPGWQATNIGELMDSISRRPCAENLPIIAQLAKDAKQIASDTIAQFAKADVATPTWPLVGTSGSPPPQLEDPVTGANYQYQMAWQLPVWAWGMQWIDAACGVALEKWNAWAKTQGGDTISADVIADLIDARDRAREAWQTLISFFGAHCYDQATDRYLYAYGKAPDGTGVKVWHAIDGGVGMWFLAPMQRALESGFLLAPTVEEFRVRLLNHAKLVDPTRHVHCANLAPGAFGMTTLVPAMTGEASETLAGWPISK